MRGGEGEAVGMFIVVDAGAGSLAVGAAVCVCTDRPSRLALLCCAMPPTPPQNPLSMLPAVWPGLADRDAEEGQPLAAIL